MDNFVDFSSEIKKQFDNMSNNKMFVVDVEKDVMWDTYLESFPEGTNKIFRERREYDCQCCKQFIKVVGNVVAISNGKLVSIWDVKIDGHFQIVADKMSKMIKSHKIKNEFLHYESKVGTKSNIQQLESGETIKWNHFYVDVPSKFIKDNDTIGTLLSKSRSNFDVLLRSLNEISLDAAEIVYDLIEQNSIYRGEEHKQTVSNFIKLKKEFDTAKNKEIFCWNVDAFGIRNTVIGTLICDISEGKELDDAVRMFESKVAPTNYKRPTAVVTKKMISNAEKKVKELGVEDSLYRRFAKESDITINNIIFADRTVKKSMGVFDSIKDDVKEDVKKLKKIEEVTISKFIDDIVPKSDTIEMMFENKQTNNLMSLIAPVNKDAKEIFKWDNNFSWAYNGEVADSLKERVKRAGGAVDGVLRFSIQWNDKKDNNNDFDAHCFEPNGNHIYFANSRGHSSSGMLDVDIRIPNDKIAVENITWSNINNMQTGKYKFVVHNFAHRGGKSGFSAEIEYDGKIYQYVYDKELRDNEEVIVAVLDFSKESGIKFLKSLPSTEETKNVWNISTNKFHKVKMIMNSPNHWDGKQTGNKHHFFILENCINDKPARGFFNEFLKEDFNEHRKVFEILGNKMKVENSNEQLSGLGFSSTQKNSIICKVTGTFNRTIKINF
jgi:hypothetical protein